MPTLSPHIATVVLVCLALGIAGCASEPLGGPTAPREDPLAGELTLPSGRSHWIYPDDLAYSGEASYRWPDGRVYAGTWVAGRPEGFGSETTTAGDRYRGTWRAGLRHGHGELTFADGTHYVGDFVDGVREGQGVERTDGGLYRGGWVAGAPEGVGAFHGDDGSSYEGEWRAGMRDGNGVYTATDGSRYEGQWLDDRPDGYGILDDREHGRYEGEWRAGLQQGYGRAVSPADVTYEGTWVAGRRNGYGGVTRPDGSRYEGEWRDGARHGRGRESFADGSYHDGRWENDHAQGPGTRHDRTGIEISGVWQDDRLDSGVLSLPTGLRYAGALPQARSVPAELIAWLEANAKRGDPYAQFFLGTVYADFVDPPPDPARAQTLFTAAARAGIADAQFRLALLTVDQAPSRAIALLLDAADGGHAQANALLGDCYLRGYHVPMDVPRALGYLERASAAGDLGARNDLAWVLATSETHRDPEAALALIRPIALYAQRPQHLDTLAAAYAASGDFDRATETQELAIDAATRAVDMEALIAPMRARLGDYRAGRAHREDAPGSPAERIE